MKTIEKLGVSRDTQDWKFILCFQAKLFSSFHEFLDLISTDFFEVFQIFISHSIFRITINRVVPRKKFLCIRWRIFESLHEEYINIWIIIVIIVLMDKKPQIFNLRVLDWAEDLAPDTLERLIKLSSSWVLERMEAASSKNLCPFMMITLKQICNHSDCSQANRSFVWRPKKITSSDLLAPRRCRIFHVVLVGSWRLFTA
jgi:hypothetical protein